MLPSTMSLFSRLPNDLDPEGSAQLVQANAQAYLSAGKKKGKGKG